MVISEALKNSIITGIELHVTCLVLIFMLYENMRQSFIRNSRKQDHSLTHVYIGSALMIIFDCLWTTLSNLSIVGNAAAYIINIVYFVGSSTAAFCWYFFTAKQLDSRFSNKKTNRFVVMLPYIAVMIMYLLSPWFGFIFSIEDGAYVRGSLFFIDPLIKMGYVAASMAISIVSGRHKNVEYLKRRDYEFVLFGVPILVCGIFQILIGYDFNCLGVTFGLIFVYFTGITNQDNKNAAALYSLANSFDASYIVNMDTGKIRPLRQDIMHDPNTPGMNSTDFTEHFQGVLSQILLHEDRAKTLEMFEIPKVEERFEIDSSFSIRYRVKEASGETTIHTASFIRASGGEGKREFLLGINSVQTDSLLYERNERLNKENQRLENINYSIIETVAKMVEVRDGGSGEHIVRVRKLTEVLAKEVMTEYPEFNLDENMVKMISSASVLHDVGKIAIPDAVLLKPGRLTPEEFEIMKTHSAEGCEILNLFPLGLDDAFMECALSICRWHHEKYDGKGYPDGLVGDDIPLAAQIVSVADCFDALVSDRPYKKAFTPEEAFEMIVNGECGAFSPKILKAFEKSFKGAGGPVPKCPFGDTFDPS